MRSNSNLRYDWAASERSMRESCETRPTVPQIRENRVIGSRGRRNCPTVAGYGQWRARCVLLANAGRCRRLSEERFELLGGGFHEKGNPVGSVVSGVAGFGGASQWGLRRQTAVV